MRNLAFGIVATLGLSGCTNEQLRWSTVRQAMTLNEIQHRQVMQNLATFAANQYAIPRHVTLKDGAAQITDSGTIAGQVISDSFLNLGAGRSVTDLWNMEPVTNDVELRMLRVAYRRAFGAEDDLYTDGLANDLAHELKEQTYQIDDLRTSLANAEVTKRGGFFGNLLKTDEPDTVAGPDYVGTVDKPTAEVKTEQSDGRDFTITTKRTVPEKSVTHDDIPGISTQKAKERRDKFNKLVSGNHVDIIMPWERVEPDTLLTVPTGKLDAYGNMIFRESTPLVVELRRQIYDTNNELEEITSGWLGCSRDKHDVPKNACYVAYAKECGSGCYVWVCPDHMREFEDFTLKIMGLSGLIREPNVTGSTGVRFTPTGGGAGAVGGMR
ncbi:hypothetical protein [Paludisphaera rhizosphaerae]|uniref:hypothetical protein n=1 Tax=Paludisphaera rhizosphaerae TaxID=2711216 RepID=UPI0013EC4E2F|nr:hypothetical protein [Paludisphaera rhizosphaerae]